jgi:hypothetical protein
MSEHHEDYKKRWVTNEQLETELQRRPTSWEVRTLILAAVVANQLIPSLNLGPNPARTAIEVIIGVIPF